MVLKITARGDAIFCISPCRMSRNTNWLKLIVPQRRYFFRDAKDCVSKYFSDLTILCSIWGSVESSCYQ